MSSAERAAAVAAVQGLVRAARVLERATGDLGISQYRVLSAIAAGEDRAARVAERFELGRPAVSAAVDVLCREGLVRRSEAAGDQRAFDLAVTPAGRRRLQVVEDDMVAVLSDLCARVGAAGRDVMAAAGPPDGLSSVGVTHAMALQTLASLGPAVDALVAERHRCRREIAT
ncbi:MAG: MarR family winged helix-turn-helix transcriptional regulator [Mycobacteriales bacterium]